MTGGDSFALSLVSTIHRELRATLPRAPGINRTYRSGRGGWYKTKAVTAWETAAILTLRVSGFRTLPPGLDWLSTFCVLHTERQDCDAPIKPLVDAVAYASGVDDTSADSITIVKKIAAGPAERIDVAAVIHPVANGDE